MKFVIFTPVVAASAIGRVAALVNRELVDLGHEITVVRSESRAVIERSVDESDHEMSGEVINWYADGVTDLVLGADVVIYHIGNNVTFHEGSLHWLPHARGLVCLHDYFVGNLYLGWCHINALDPLNGVRRAYGASAAEMWDHEMADNRISLELVERAPMTEWICAQALGVVVHSDWMIERVEASCLGPISVTPLAYVKPSTDLQAESSPDGRVTRILTVGHIIENKRVESVIRAIGSSEELRTAVEYHVVGPASPAVIHKLAKLARNNDVRLVVSGHVLSEALGQALTEADIVVALRWPNLESASATAIEAMLAKRPLIVSDAGPSCGIPENCVLKVAVDDEIDGLRKQLMKLVGDPVGRMAMAERAYTFASKAHAPKAYAESLLAIAGQALVVAPRFTGGDALEELTMKWGQLPCQSLQLIHDPLTDVFQLDSSKREAAG